MKTRIATSAYQEMLKTVGSQPAEAGGLLFGSREDWVITKFLYDKNAHTTRTTYSFDVGYLNPMIEKLGKEGLELLGFFHSHPTHYTELSNADREYFQRQFKNIPVNKFLTPLMFPAIDGTYDFIPYVFHKDGRVERTELDILPDDYTTHMVHNMDVEFSEYVFPPIQQSRRLTFGIYLMGLVCILCTGVLLFILGALQVIYTHLEFILNI
ncbi:MAG: Mov34/MPN/PAD-1 family protein [Bacteroidota bacterium]